MASVTSQAPRRPSAQSEPALSQASSSETIARTNSSESEVIVLNNSSTQLGAPSAASPQPSNPEIRRCWICFGDKTEDTEETSVWRSPCPCSLIAHEACLLEWIADKEAPSQGQVAQLYEIQCPQCKAPITIQRPRDVLVTLVDGVQRTARFLILPSALLGVAGCVYSGFLTYGANAVAVVFGSEAANTHLAPVLSLGFPESKLAGAALSLVPFFPRWHGLKSLPYFVYLPFIAPALITLRTNFGDMGFSLVMPLYFFPPANRTFDWPPSPGLAFATVPYLRSFYLKLYKHTFADLEKKWDLSVQRTPREGETAEQIAAAQDDDEEHAIFELEIIRDVPVEQEAPNQPPAQNAVEQNQNENQDNNPPAPAPNPQEAGGGWGNFEMRQDVSATLSADTIMGALFFPAISAAVGELLKISLPSHLISRSVNLTKGGNGRGILMEKWGRSLVGGCLFVVLKDAVTLYCKWRRSKNFGERRVLDFMGGDGRRGDGGGRKKGVRSAP